MFTAIDHWGSAGGFSTRVELPVAARAWDAVVTDMNGDGWTDVVIADDGARVHVLLGNPTSPRSLVRGPVYFAGTTPQRVATGDLDGNGRPDLVVSNRLPWSLTGSISVFLAR